MPKPFLINLVKTDKPLVEVYIALEKGLNLEQIIEELNTLADDFEVFPYVYNKLTGDNDLSADATPESLFNLFGWEVQRVSARNFNLITKEYEDIIEGLFVWEAIDKPSKFPDCINGKVLEIALIQPGTNDDGQPYS